MRTEPDVVSVLLPLLLTPLLAAQEVPMARELPTSAAAFRVPLQVSTPRGVSLPPLPERMALSPFPTPPVNPRNQ